MRLLPVRPLSLVALLPFVGLCALGAGGCGTSGSSAGQQDASVDAGGSGDDGPGSGADGSSGTDGSQGGPDGGGGGHHEGGARDSGGPAGEGGAGSLVPGTSKLTITAAGMARTVYLYVPQAVTTGPVPLVIALHGDGDTAQNFVTTVGLGAAYSAQGFVVAAPQGITRNIPVYDNGSVVQTVPQVDWDPYNSIQSNGSITADHNLDVPLLDAIRTQLVASGSIDVQHVVVYGYSQGGYLSFRYGMSTAAAVACEAVLAAASPLSGTTLIEQAARKLPVALQIGTADSAYSAAQQTDQELVKNGNPVQFTPVQGAGHVPPPGSPLAPLTWCLGQPL